ncbi:MAG TPA: pyridoxal-phosphate dependent enzyme [Chitinophagaceae bacterium]|nr:pyridoxal-phosphate dependent enzyme [Chitinophagaceae bacterium]
MHSFSTSHITIDPVQLSILQGKKITLEVLRLDKIHPLVSGNKWFKLKYYLEQARQNNNTIVTFGGAWSNHIVATAAACRHYGLMCIGIIRGEESPTPTPALIQAKELGMQFIFSSRADYAHKKIPEEFKQKTYCIIPEGGYGILGVQGAATIAEHYTAAGFSHICCAVGTGTMMAGLILAATNRQTILGISVLKNHFDLMDSIRHLTPGLQIQSSINHDYHFGGYARMNPELIAFMNEFFRLTGIPSDFVYTGKLFYAVNDLLKKDYFPDGSKILLVHSGGLQGNASLPGGTLIF